MSACTPQFHGASSSIGYSSSSHHQQQNSAVNVAAPTHYHSSLSPTAPTTKSPVMSVEMMDQFDHALRRESETLAFRPPKFQPIRFAESISSSSAVVVGGILNQTASAMTAASSTRQMASVSASAGHVATHLPHHHHRPPVNHNQQQQTAAAAATTTNGRDHLGRGVSPPLLDDDERSLLKTEIALAVVRRAGVGDCRLSSAELDELVDAIIKELSKTPLPTSYTGQSQTQSASSAGVASPTPRGAEGRATIISELQWSELRETIAGAELTRPGQPMDQQNVMLFSASAGSPRNSTTGTRSASQAAAATPTGTIWTASPALAPAQRGGSTVTTMAPTPTSASVVATTTTAAAAAVDAAAQQIKPAAIRVHDSKVSSAANGNVKVRRDPLRQGKRIRRSESSAFSECSASSTAEISSEQSQQTISCR